MQIIFCLIGLIWLTVPLEGKAQTPLTSEEIQIVLDRHNYWRRDVGVNEKLEWSNEMALLASDWSRKLSDKGCAFEHRPDNKFGENLFKGTK